jgi:CHAT domain-containing protein
MTLKHGDLLSVRKEADDALKLYPSPETEWHWRFVVLKAQVLEQQGDTAESQALLKPDLPTSFGATDFAVRRKLVLAIDAAYADHFTEAAQYIAEAHASAEQNHPELLGEVALRKGTVCFLASNYQEAEIAYRDSLARARQAKDPFYETAALSGLGVTLTRQERYDESIDADREALRLAESIGARYSEAQVSGNLAWCYRKLGDYENALSNYQKAEELSKQMGIVADQIYWLAGISNVYYEQQDYQPAETVLSQALDLARSSDDKSIITEYLTDLSEIDLETGKIDAAENYYNEAIQIKQGDSNPADAPELLLVGSRIEEAKHDYARAQQSLERVISNSAADSSQKWRAEAQLAKIYMDQGLDARAESEFRHSLETVDVVRSSVHDEELRMPFLSTALSFYDDYIEFLIAHQRMQDALQVAELSRARTLAEGLGARSTHFSFSSRNFQPQQIARRLNATLLFYWSGEKRSHLWLITSAKLSWFPLSAKSEIDGAVKAYRQSVVNGQDVLAGNSASARQLYDMLVGPARQFIPKNSRVILLPAENLNALNFETLIVPEPNPHFWIEDVILSEAGSLTLLSGAIQNAATREKNLLLVGNPDSADPSFPALVQAPAEIEKVSSHFPDPQCTVLQGKKATASAYFHSNPDRYSYLHFVTHGIASQTRPLESAVILSRDGDSYKLYARDIVAHPLKAQLVTISACNGAGTRAYAGEGLVGLSWAFLRAGAHNVIASLWEVSDASSTAQLMDALYAGLDRGEDPAAALRDAKLLVLKSNANTVFRKPFYWAPFQLYIGS